jgi:hypothetical protein
LLLSNYEQIEIALMENFKTFGDANLSSYYLSNDFFVLKRYLTSTNRDSQPIKMDSKSNVSSTATSSLDNHSYLQSFVRVQEFINQLNGKVIFGNMLAVIVFFISFLQMLGLSLNYKFIYGDYTSIVLKYVTYVTR